MEDNNKKNEPSIGEFLVYANSIIATLREPFLVLDKNLRVISANQAFFTIFEVAEKDTLGQLLPDLGNRQWDVPKLIQLLKEIIPERKIVKDYKVDHKFEYIGERSMILNACRLRVSKKIAAIITTEAAEEEGKGEEEEELILVAIEDITARERLQRELFESEERFRRAFETSPDGLLLVHKVEAGILNSNASVQKLLGYSKDELLEKKLWGIGVTKDDKEFKQLVLELERDGVVHYEDALVKNKNGLSISAEVFLVDRTKVIQCNIRDITERKAAEEALSQEKAKAKEYFDTATVIMLVLDIDGKVTLINEKGCDILGYKKEEIEGKNWFDNFVPESIRKEVRSVFHRVANAEEGLLGYYENFVIAKSGEERLIAWNNTVLKDSAGKVTSVLSSGDDITERKRMGEEARKRLQELEIFYKASIGREERILELKKEVEMLKKELGK